MIYTQFGVQVKVVRRLSADKVVVRMIGDRRGKRGDRERLLSELRATGGEKEILAAAALADRPAAGKRA